MTCVMLSNYFVIGSLSNLQLYSTFTHIKNIYIYIYIYINVCLYIYIYIYIYAKETHNHVYMGLTVGSIYAKNAYPSCVKSCTLSFTSKTFPLNEDMSIRCREDQGKFAPLDTNISVFV